jgi:nicotinic acid mononucleotide adenylyltransferase
LPALIARRRPVRQCCRQWLLGLYAWGSAAGLQAAPLPAVPLSGGLQLESQGAGTPNSLSGNLFAPLANNARGDLIFLDGSLNLNNAASLTDTKFGASSRLGYRWLAPRHNWIVGLNAGLDATPYQSTYFTQATAGLELLSKQLELRLNGYKPINQTNLLLESAETVQAIGNNRLAITNTQTYGVALGSVDIEAGMPILRWRDGNLWLYAGYYSLSGDYTASTPGYRARVEARLSHAIALGGNLSRDEIFGTRASGYLQLRFSRPAERSAGTSPEQLNFLAQRGLPVSRERNVRTRQVQISKLSFSKAYCVLFSGSFDPAHLGHLDVLDTALAYADSDCAFVILNQASIFKPNLTAYAIRKDMATIIFYRPGEISTGDEELNQAFANFSLEDVLKVLRQRYPHTRYFSVLGDDVLQSGIVDFLTDADLTYLIAYRNGNPSTLPPAPVKSAFIYPAGPKNCSSTAIRVAYSQGFSNPPCTTPALNQYIETNGLYRVP